MPTITWGDGSTEDTTILTEVASEATTDDSHEFVLWDDNSLSIEAVEYALTGDDTLDHCRLPLQSVVKLKGFLNSERITNILTHEL